VFAGQHAVAGRLRAFVAAQPQGNGWLEKLAARLLAAPPNLDNDVLQLLGVGRLRPSFSRPLGQAHLAVEGFDRVFAIPAKVSLTSSIIALLPTLFRLG
jgi:hypothetical protein